eukprot:TRINITY_DN449_c0_g1_i1.p1 TRINITY_DN449_c0_g1~~TRINITY_DN449_c0_g1_i1.p1  ORF type:complete len:219 (+),score=25.25 TRINITY_DN449_c0_g1_i1:64-720(+)
MQAPPSRIHHCQRGCFDTVTHLWYGRKVCWIMIMFSSSAKFATAMRAPNRAICLPLRAVVRPEGAPAPEPNEEPNEEGAAKPAPILNRNPKTGNPQTGKLIDVYFEVGSMLVVIAVAVASWMNASHVLQQTGSADSVREPASKQEWLAMDSKGVYGPCGGDQVSDAAIEDMLEGRPCTTAEYARAAPAAQTKQQVLEASSRRFRSFTTIAAERRKRRK